MMKQFGSMKVVAAAALMTTTVAQAQTANQGADKLRYLPHAKSALSSMYLDIASARKSIDMTYFIFDPCSTVGRIVIKKMSEKAKEGVPVRILLDGTSQGPNEWGKLTGVLKKRGIELRYFNREFYSESQGWSEMNIEANWRTHAKITLVDGERYITGGRNIADDYYSLQPGFNFLDRDARVEGPSAKQAVKYYNELWNSQHTFTADVAPENDVNEFEKWCLVENNQRADAVEAWLEANAAQTVAGYPVHACKDTEFVQDNPAFRKDRYAFTNFLRSMSWRAKENMKEKRMTHTVLDLLDNTQKRVYIENWAYIPSWGIKQRFDAIRKDPKKNIYVVSNDITDVGPMATMQLDAIKRDNMDKRIAGVSKHGRLDDTWEMTPDKEGQFMLHSKVWTFDGKHTLVSSYNLDPRSYHTNVESGVLARNCPAFHNEVAKHSKELADLARLDRRDCAKCKEVPEISWKDRFHNRLKREFY